MLLYSEAAQKLREAGMNLSSVPAGRQEGAASQFPSAYGFDQFRSMLAYGKIGTVGPAMDELRLCGLASFNRLT